MPSHPPKLSLFVANRHFSGPDALNRVLDGSDDSDNSAQDNRKGDLAKADDSSTGILAKHRDQAVIPLARTTNTTNTAEPYHVAKNSACRGTTNPTFPSRPYVARIEADSRLLIEIVSAINSDQQKLI